MEVRKAQLTDVNDIMNIYYLATERMSAEGNKNQWNDEESFLKGILNYISEGKMNVVVDDEIVGFYAQIYGIDKTYNEIKGKWLNDEEYVTIHKIASKYPRRHIASFILKQVEQEALRNNIRNIRIDTHYQNISMQEFLKNQGFVYCGVISIACDFANQASLRNAYLKRI